LNTTSYVLDFKSLLILSAHSIKLKSFGIVTSTTCFFVVFVAILPLLTFYKMKIILPNPRIYNLLNLQKFHFPPLSLSSLKQGSLVSQASHQRHKSVRNLDTPCHVLHNYELTLSSSPTL